MMPVDWASIDVASLSEARRAVVVQLQAITDVAPEPARLTSFFCLVVAVAMTVLVILIGLSR